MILLLLIFSASNISFSQEHNVHRVKYIFDPAANAAADLKNALSIAGKIHKNVLILVGGDWSNSSVALNREFSTGDLKPYVDEHYVYLRVNFTPEKKNADVLGPYDYPKNEGYPIMLILNSDGKKIVAKSCEEYKTAYHLPYDEHKILLALHRWESTDTKEHE